MITPPLHLNNLNNKMMHVQKELGSPVKEVFHQAMINVFLAYNRCNEDVRHAVLPFEITAQQFNVLRILRGQHPKPSTINLIKARMLDKMCDASRIVDRLVQKDLVNKNTNAYDKRAVDIVISDKGIQLLKKTDKEIDLSAIISSSLTLEEAEQLNGLLNKITGGKD